jgi:hypothetical protein
VPLCMLCCAVRCSAVLCCGLVPIVQHVPLEEAGPGWAGVCKHAAGGGQPDRHAAGGGSSPTGTQQEVGSPTGMAAGPIPEGWHSSCSWVAAAWLCLVNVHTQAMLVWPSSTPAHSPHAPMCLAWVGQTGGWPEGETAPGDLQLLPQAVEQGWQHRQGGCPVAPLTTCLWLPQGGDGSGKGCVGCGGVCSPLEVAWVWVSAWRQQQQQKQLWPCWYGVCVRNALNLLQNTPPLAGLITACTQLMRPPSANPLCPCALLQQQGVWGEVGKQGAHCRARRDLCAVCCAPRGDAVLRHGRPCSSSSS